MLILLNLTAMHQGGWDKLQALVIKLTFHSKVDRDIQEVRGSSKLLTALVLKFAGAQLLY